MSLSGFGGSAPVALCAALLILSAIMFPVALAQQFSQVTEPGNDSTDRSPRLAALGDSLLVAWVSLEGPDSDIMYRFRHKETWSDPGKLVESTGFERDVALCTSGGRIYAAWATDSPLYTTGQDWDIALSVYDHGTGWSAPVELTEPGDAADDYSPFLVPYQNGVIVLWSSMTGEDGHILMSIYTGGTASGPYNLTEGWKGMNRNPVAAFLDGTLWVTWSSNDNRHTDGSDLDIVAAPVDIQGRTLGEVAELSDPEDTEDDLYPGILALDSRLYVAWQSRDKTVGPSDGVDIGLAVFDGAWNTHALSSPYDTGNDIYPHLFEFNGNPWIAWQSSDTSLTGGDDWDIVVAEIEDNALGSIRVITEGKDHMDEGGTVVRGHDAMQVGGDIIVVWETPNPEFADGTDKDIAMAVLPRILQEKTDEARRFGILPVLVLAGFLGGIVAFLLLKGPGTRKSNDTGESPRRKGRFRN